MHLGVLDIGTNSVHMLIVRVKPDLTYDVIDRFKEFVHLGRGVFSNGRLDEETQAHALRALTQFQRLAEKRGVERFVAVATSAVREASNGGAFLQEVYERTGIAVKLITGVEEGRLVFRAIQGTLSPSDEPVAVVDLGGGSLEVAAGNGRKMSWVRSLKVGCRRLVEVALKDGEVTQDRARAMHDDLQEALGPVLKRARSEGVERCYLTSGSAGAVLKILQARGDVPPTAEEIPRKALAALDDDLALLTRARRAKLNGLDPQRVDLIVPATAVFRILADGLGLDRLHVSERGLREGLVADFLDREGPELQLEDMEPNARRRQVLGLARRLHYDAPHGNHVARLAVELFDGTRTLHGLDERARELLEYGAILHDVGYIVGEAAHHKHSEYLILHGLDGSFAKNEVLMIAAIARYHRKAWPKDSHKVWASLAAADREIVRTTAGILRVADGLDRSHSRAVEGLGVHIEDERLDIELNANEATELEIWAAKRKADLLEAVFKKPVHIHSASKAVKAAVRAGR